MEAIQVNDTSFECHVCPDDWADWDRDTGENHPQDILRKWLDENTHGRRTVHSARMSTRPGYWCYYFVYFHEKTDALIFKMTFV